LNEDVIVFRFMKPLFYVYSDLCHSTSQKSWWK